MSNVMCYNLLVSLELNPKAGQGEKIEQEFIGVWVRIQSYVGPMGRLDREETSDR